jgi:hypothetical protein
MDTWANVIDKHCQRLANDHASADAVANICTAVELAHQATAAVQDLDGWGEKPGIRDAALHLNMGRAELREASSGQSAFADSIPPPVDVERAEDVVARLVTLLASVYRALVAALEPGGPLAGDLPAARAALEIDEARRALCARPLA